MLRRGVRLRSANYSNFLTETPSSSDDSKPIINNVKLAPVQKRGRKKKTKQVMDLSESSVEEVKIDTKKKLKKKKEKKTTSPSKRKIIKGKRRLENHENPVTSSSVSKITKAKEVSPKLKSTKVRICRASPPLLKLNEFKDTSSDEPISIIYNKENVKKHVTKKKSPLQDKEDKENEEFMTASDFSSPSKSPGLKINPAILLSPLKLPSLKINQVFAHEEDKIETLVESQPKYEDKFDGTFQLDDDYSEKLGEETFEIIKDKNVSSGSNRNTFEVDGDLNDSTSKKQEVGSKSKRRGTYEIDASEDSKHDRTYEVDNSSENKSSDEVEKKRSTFEVPEGDSFIISTKKSKRAVKKNSDTSSVKTLNFPSSKQGSNTDSDHEVLDIQVSSSSLLTDSGLSSASKLLRRARKLNPQSDTSTPNVSIKQSTPKPKVATDSKRQVSSRVKRVPNYAAIHKKTFEKMESLDDHVQRKKDRANALLSGVKVLVGTKVSPNETSTKKQLFPAADSPNKSISFRFAHSRKQSTNKKETPAVRKHLAAGDATSNVLETTKRQPLKKAVSFNAKSPPKPLSTIPKTPKPTREQVWKTVGTKIPKPVGPAPNNLVLRNITLVKKLAKDDAGEKVATKSEKVSKKENLLRNIKSVSTKSKGSSSSVDSRRDHIKGVRSNRRFDLLMNMRKI